LSPCEVLEGRDRRTTQASQCRPAVGCRGADRWGSLPNGAPGSRGWGRIHGDRDPTPALWRSACWGGRMRHGALPTLRRDVRCCRHAPPASCLPSTGREPGAPRPSSARPAAVFPCPRDRSLALWQTRSSPRKRLSRRWRRPIPGSASALTVAMRSRIGSRMPARPAPPRAAARSAGSPAGAVARASTSGSR